MILPIFVFENVPYRTQGKFGVTYQNQNGVYISLGTALNFARYN